MILSVELENTNDRINLTVSIATLFFFSLALLLKLIFVQKKEKIQRSIMSLIVMLFKIKLDDGYERHYSLRNRKTHFSLK